MTPTTLADVNSTDTLRVLMQGLRDAGLSPDRELGRLGVAVEGGAAARPLDREAYVALWTRATAASGDSGFALRVAAETPRGALGPLEWLAITAPTLGAGLEALARHGRMLHTGGAYSVERRGTRAAFVYHPGRTAVARPILDWSFGYLVRSLRQVCTVGDCAVKEVRLTYARPDDAAEVEAAFGVPVVFGATVAEIVLCAKALEQPLPTRDDAVHASLATVCAARCAALGEEQLVPKARATVMLALEREELPTLETLAKQLGTSCRSLQRALRREGTSFREVLLDARMAIAERWLANGERTAQAVAYGLGYADPSAFHRAYRGYFGRTPRAA